MPVTPFHFGVGGLAKGLAPKRVSLAAFAVSQVVIDLEPGYYLLVRQWPLHRWTHRLVVALPLGAAVGAGLWLMGRFARKWLPVRWRPSPEIALGPGVLGGVLGGATHPLLDAIMHSDVVPFWPFVTGNPLHGLMGVGSVYLLCLGAGAVGYLVWAGRSTAERHVRAPAE